MNKKTYTQKKAKFLWQTIQYSLNKYSVFQFSLILDHLRSFWKNNINNLTDKEHILILIKLQFKDGAVLSLGKLFKLNNQVKPKQLMESLILGYNKLVDSYNVKTPINLIINYSIKKGEIIPSFSIEIDYKINFIKVKKLRIPIASPFTGPTDYGKLVSQDSNFTSVIPHTKSMSKVTKEKNIVLNIFKKSEDIFNFSMITNKKVVSWVDKIINEKFIIRTLEGWIYFFKNGEIVLTKKEINSKPIKPLIIPIKRKINNKFLTMDIETINKNNILIPYLICLYDGKTTKSFFTNKLDEESSFNLVKNLVKFLSSNKFKGYKIYLHNFAKFDSYFILKYLTKLGICWALLHDGKLLQLEFKGKNMKSTIFFRDSFLLLPSSLKKLSESFKIENPKINFPILFSDLNYKGVVPKIEYFKDLSQSPWADYNKYLEQFKGKIWNFKTEAIKYCELDCISLHQILKLFNQLIFDKFKININSSPTIPSLAFKIYRSHFMPNIDKIHSLTGSTYKSISQGYKGGATDMYIPRLIKGKKLYAYDVNSLYPYVMKQYMYPIGNPSFFKGDIFNLTDPFGFFYCKIVAPKFLLHPIILTTQKFRTIAPLGSWEGMYFSEEIKEAKKLGYEIEVLWGYTFEKGYIFKDYIDQLYNLRLSYSKSDPMNMIAKLLLNSLYGKFGMSPDLPETTIIKKEAYPDFIKKIPGGENSIVLIEELGDHFLIQFSNTDPLSELEPERESKKAPSVNIAIASAVTSYARIHMSKFKNRYGFPNLYYTDTDSLYFDGPLPDHYISGIELGKLKLEGIWDDAIFLAPKVYALKNERETIIKVKGVKKEAIKEHITFETLKGLLNQSSLALNQKKWFRSYDKGSIEIRDQIYTLKQTALKRELIFDNGIASGTNAFNINK